MLTHVFVVFLVLGVCPQPSDPRIDSAANSSYKFEEIARCGPNSLFMFLILSGHPEITLEQCCNLPFSAQGTSLLAMRDAATRFQVDAGIRHYRPDDIEALCLPAIIQIKGGNSSAITKYHFDVVYRVDTDRVYVIDGTTGAMRFMYRSRLGDFWTGFALSRKKLAGGFNSNEWLASLLVISLLVTDGYVAIFFLRRFAIAAVAWKRKNPNEVDL